MPRLASCFALLLAVGFARGDSFDYYTNRHLQKATQSPLAEKSAKVTLEDLVTTSQVLPGLRSAFLVVKTNDGRFAKLLVQPAQQKFGKDDTVPILLIERFVTFRDGEDRTIHQQANNVRLFHDFRLNLDIGQIVPENRPADLRFVADKGNVYLEPLGKAELFLISKHLPEAVAPKGGKVVVGEKFDPALFNGVYKLHDDGKRTGNLHLKVSPKGDVTGHYYSDVDGTKYDVEGLVGPNPPSAIQFRITYPRTIQFFTGRMFTGDAQAITGSSRIEEREAGFYAVRLKND